MGENSGYATGFVQACRLVMLHEYADKVLTRLVYVSASVFSFEILKSSLKKRRKKREKKNPNKSANKSVILGPTSFFCAMVEKTTTKEW